MRYIEDTVKKTMRLSAYVLLAGLSGVIGFLGYRVHDGLSVKIDGHHPTLLQHVYADTTSDGDGASDGDSDGGGADGGAGGNGGGS